MEGPKKRTSNFTNDEKRILSELVFKYKDTVECKRTDATTNADKSKAWIRLAQEFNNISTHCHRTHTALKCCWENIKRQTKKDRADKKKKLFMTGGGRPPTPPPSNQESGIIVEAILGPALEGISNIYDSDAGINEIIELNCPVKKVHNTFEDNETKENIDSIQTIEDKNKTMDLFIEEDIRPSTSKGILKENNVDDTWSTWTPNNLKTPVSGALRVQKQNEEDDWLRRRRPNKESLLDLLTKEKIKLVKILQENAVKESNIRLAVLEEQLKQEKMKTQKLIE